VVVGGAVVRLLARSSLVACLCYVKPEQQADVRECYGTLWNLTFGGKVPELYGTF